MQRHLAAANSGVRSQGTALLLSTSNICASSHFAIGQSKQFLSTQISLGATNLKLGKVADEVPPILSNFLCGTMCTMCHVSHVTCHVSSVTCHLSPVTCHLSHVNKNDFTFFLFKKITFRKNWTKQWSQLVQGLLSTEPTPSSFF